MQAWGKDQKVGLSMIQLMADPKGDLTKALDLELTHPGPTEEKGLWGRCKRHAIYAVNGEIKAIQVAEGPDDPAGDAHPEPTLADTMIEIIEKIKKEG
mmetsp:Transcript_79670/g.231298  ORF Transcript_79670/g.231298 Transcript_79670/m.231298 type:complete len:98 (-) Transcript_79670:301-594(-)|eukprot:CAMPEP_0176004416 /NCGR_PEP_ID=MMETSP0120_2-20121206/1681_1 /TAXON_ID=160619 /ORGANISM="Kryptoperidinium foliaceum, Strain CCMP 1326" /LENGTH=97 /DNA_ID=CAMNT_0017337095 /DNA_START=395 /DNA_END=688 /DNA_ORIENTATION=-